MKIKSHVPNFITSLNLLSGCIGVYFAFLGNIDFAFYAILLSAVFDFFDGFAARILKAYSPMGKELDSLADVVSFGVLPGAIVFSVLSKTALNEWMCFLAFLIPIFSALRLAKFNIDERQSNSFIGLPTPANAIFFGSLAFSYPELLIQNYQIFIGIVVLFCYLLVAEIPMFALKLKSIKLKDNKIQYVFLLITLVLLLLFKQNSFAPIIAWYILLSVIQNIAIKRIK